MLFFIPVYDYLKHSVHFHENEWKLINRQVEDGAPLAVTIDHQTLEDETVTVRERDSMSQDRIKIAELESFIVKQISFP